MKFVVSLIIIFTFSMLIAAEFEITSKIKENPAHLGLQMLDKEYKYDNNGELCALLIVRCGVKDINFSNTASKVAQIDKQGEYYITMKKGARYIVMKKDGFGSFKEQFGLVMKSGSVYEMSADEKFKQASQIPVVITCNQNGAEVFVDEISKRKTQNKMLTINIDIGSHKIKVKKDGFATQEINKSISAENNSFNFTLEEIEPVILTIKSNPTGASVTLDGASQGVTNCQPFMFPGTYKLKVSLNKYETIEENITISESGNNTFSYDLFKITSQLTINVTPSDATILINNTVLNGHSKEVGPGKYKIEVEKEGYFSETKTITITKGQNKNVTFELIQKTGKLQISVNPMEASSVLKYNGSTYKSWNGSKSLKDVPVGEYTLYSSLTGYQSVTKRITITLDRTVNENVILEVDTSNRSEGQIRSEDSDNMVFVQGGSLQVESIKELPTTHMNLKVRDADGKFAPVLIVKTELRGLGFQNVSRPTKHAAEYMAGNHQYKFYMNDNQRVIKITHANYEPLEVRLLADFNINVKAQRVYEMVIKLTANGYKTNNEEIILETKQMTLEEDNNMVFVQGGTFQMGSNNGYDREKPVHSVTVSDFYIGKYEVTQKEWRDVMGSNPSKFKGDNLPVEKVSWNNVQKFIKKLNAKTGLNYRLPTEAEWEYASRGGSRTAQYKYSGSNDIGSVAWYSSNSGSKTHSVGGKKPNELGIYDMSGNVWEWCNDWYGDYSSSSQINPRGTSSGSIRVYRGGSWNNRALYCRVAYRNPYTPDNSDNRLGFRLLRSSK